MFQEILEYSVKKDNINPTSYSTTGCLPSRINYLIIVYAIIAFKSFLRLIQYSFLNHVCASSCFASGNYHFAYLFGYHTNIIEYLSISLCSSLYEGHAFINLRNGCCWVENSNCSLNRAAQNGFCISYPSPFTCIFCTFSENNMSYSTCINFYKNNGVMTYANIIHNISPFYGMIYVYEGLYRLNYCIFDMNQGPLFNEGYCSLDISNSFISHSGFSSSSNNNSLTKMASYPYCFFKTQFCHADNSIVRISSSITNHETPYLNSVSLFYLFLQ